jgi:hypothetical protein
LREIENNGKNRICVGSKGQVEHHLQLNVLVLVQLVPTEYYIVSENLYKGKHGFNGKLLSENISVPRKLTKN